MHLRLRQDPEDLLPGMRPWRSVLDREMTQGEGFTVSELLEVFMVAARSNLLGIIPHSMIKLAEEWFRLRAYGWTYQNSAQRTRSLASWQHHYNWHRPHAGIGGAFPMSRLNSLRNNLLTVHN